MESNDYGYRRGILTLLGAADVLAFNWVTSAFAPLLHLLLHLLVGWLQKGYAFRNTVSHILLMATVSTTSGSAAAQYGFGQLQLQQAKRNAEQAERVAQSLQTQAAEARRNADLADQNAKSLAGDSSQARSNADQARRGLAVVQSTGQAATQIATVADRVAAQQQQSVQSESATATKAAPVVNTQGQVTGTVVNTTA